MTWVVLHVDLDQFVVAVELLRRPELRGRPVLVGGTGDPTRRGVVAGASYEARAYGVRSGTPLRTAARRCPEAVFLPLDRDAYVAASEQVMAVLAARDGVLERLGWDEAFLGVDTGDADGAACRIQADVHAATGLRCSVGIGDNRLRAKTATGFGKPGGVFTLPAQDWLEVMGPRPCDALWGVGARTAKTLAGLGLHNVAALAAADPGQLAAAFGPRTGPALGALARGESSAAVRSEPRQARPRGREVTFDTDTDTEDPALVRAELLRLLRVLTDDLACEQRDAVRVVVTLRTRPFRTRTHGVAVRPPSHDREVLQAAATAALATFGDTGPVRLVGVRAELGPGR